MNEQIPDFRGNPPTTTAWRGSWLTRPRGATATEYLIIVVCCALGLLAAIQIFGGGLHNQFDSAVSFVGLDSDDGERADRQSSSSTRTASRDRSDAESGRAYRGAEEDQELVDAPEGTGREHVPIRAEDQEATGSVGGINPLVLILLIVGTLFLGYVVFSEDE